MRFRRVDIPSRVSRSPDSGPWANRADGALVAPDCPSAAAGVATVGWAELGAAAGAGEPPFATCSSTSGLLTTPPRPVPGTSPTNTPDSSATRRAAGDDLTASEPAEAAEAGAPEPPSGARVSGAAEAEGDTAGEDWAVAGASAFAAGAGAADVSPEPAAVSSRSPST